MKRVANVIGCVSRPSGSTISGKPTHGSSADCRWRSGRVGRRASGSMPNARRHWTRWSGTRPPSTSWAGRSVMSRPVTMRPALPWLVSMRRSARWSASGGGKNRAEQQRGEHARQLEAAVQRGDEQLATVREQLERECAGCGVRLKSSANLCETGLRVLDLTAAELGIALRQLDDLSATGAELQQQVRTLESALPSPVSRPKRPGKRRGASSRTTASFARSWSAFRGSSRPQRRKTVRWVSSSGPVRSIANASGSASRPSAWNPTSG